MKTYLDTIWAFNVFTDSSFVPPLVYAMLGTSRDVAVGTVAVVSLLLASMLSDEVSPTTNPELYMQLALTATFLAGVFQATLGIFRLELIIYTSMRRQLSLIFDLSA